MSSSLVIEELTGAKRRLELRGAGLPFQGAAWGGTTTLATSWNPGNPEATQHVLGPQEMPSDWEGEWNTTRLVAAPCLFSESGGAPQSVVFASTLMEVLDDFRRQANLLRVTWAEEKELKTTAANVTTQTFRVVRVGRIEEANFRVDRQDDVKWKATFVWVGRGEARKPAANRSENLLATLRRSITEANAAASKILLDDLRSQQAREDFVTPFTLGQLEALVDAPLALADSFARFANSVTNRLKTLGDILVKVRDLTPALLGRAVDVATNAVAVSNQFVDEISRAGAETYTTQTKVSNLTRAASYYGRTQRQADLVAEACSNLVRKAQMRRSVSVTSSSRSTKAQPQEIIAVHVPRAGDTMISIARRYYGNAELAGPLSRANGLPLSTVEPPRAPIIIPSKDVLEQPNRV